MPMFMTPQRAGACDNVESNQKQMLTKRTATIRQAVNKEITANSSAPVFDANQLKEKLVSYRDNDLKSSRYGNFFNSLSEVVYDACGVELNDFAQRRKMINTIIGYVDRSDDEGLTKYLKEDKCVEQFVIQEYTCSTFSHKLADILYEGMLRANRLNSSSKEESQEIFQETRRTANQ